MDFVRSNFCTNEPLPVEHFFPHLCLQQTGQKVRKKVFMAEVHLYRIYFLQKQYFSMYILEFTHIIQVYYLSSYHFITYLEFPFLQELRIFITINAFECDKVHF